MIAAEYKSGQHLHDVAVTRFYRGMRKTCSCKCFEVRLEGCGYYCAACHRPLMARECAA